MFTKPRRFGTSNQRCSVRLFTMLLTWFGRSCAAESNVSSGHDQNPVEPMQGAAWIISYCGGRVVACPHIRHQIQPVHGIEIGKILHSVSHVTDRAPTDQN